MPDVMWPAAPGGQYWVDIALGETELLLMIDLGLVDRHGQVGFSIAAPLYEQFKQAGTFTHFLLRSRLDASGHVSLTESGAAIARLIDPVSRQRVGPAVQLQVFRGAPLVPNRVGVAFFHQLQGCKVIWDLSARTWTIELP